MYSPSLVSRGLLNKRVSPSIPLAYKELKSKEIKNKNARKTNVDLEVFDNIIDGFFKANKIRQIRLINQKIIEKDI